MKEIEKNKKETTSPPIQEMIPNSIKKIREISSKKRELLDSARPELLGISNTTGYNRELNLKEINDAIEFPESRELKKMINQRLLKRKSLKNKPSNNLEKPKKTDKTKPNGETRGNFCRDENCHGLLILGKCLKCGKDWGRGEERIITVSKAPEYKERKISGERK